MTSFSIIFYRLRICKNSGGVEIHMIPTHSHMISQYIKQPINRKVSSYRNIVYLIQ